MCVRALVSQVSRCGMIYMEPHMLGWQPLLVSWLATLASTVSDMHQDLITGLFHRVLPACLQLVRKATKVTHTWLRCVCVDGCVCVSLCYIF